MCLVRMKLHCSALVGLRGACTSQRTSQLTFADKCSLTLKLFHKGTLYMFVGKGLECCCQLEHNMRMSMDSRPDNSKTQSTMLKSVDSKGKNLCP